MCADLMGFSSSVEQMQICPTQFFTFTKVSTALLLLPEPSNGIFSRATMTGMTGGWYNPISHFEVILVGLVVLQVFVLRYLRILPMSLNDLLEDGFKLHGRRRRQISEVEHGISEELRTLLEGLLTVLRRIDEHDCLLRSICELQARSSTHKLTKGMDMTLSALRRSAQRRRKYHDISNNRTIEDPSVLSTFEDAVDIGAASINLFDEENSACSNSSSSSCQIKYSLCPLSTEDVIHYVEAIQLNEF